jgi:hypothetical protein
MQQLESIYPSARITFGLCALALMAVIIAMIRRGAIKEKYALLWLPLGFGFLVLSVFPELLVRFSTRIQLHYMTVVVLGVIVLFTNILLYFTARLSRLREDVKMLAQELAIQRAANAGAPPRMGPASSDSGWVPAEDGEGPPTRVSRNGDDTSRLT